MPNLIIQKFYIMEFSIIWWIFRIFECMVKCLCKREGTVLLS
jgi:hypothetical protein